jgi:hypothetical protein
VADTPGKLSQIPHKTWASTTSAFPIAKIFDFEPLRKDLAKIEGIAFTGTKSKILAIGWLVTMTPLR